VGDVLPVEDDAALARVQQPDLPAPFGPMIETISRSPTSIETLRRISVSP